MTVSGICSIYGKLNSKGVPLEIFDVMIARYAASGFDLREDWLGSPDAAHPGRKARIDEACEGLLDDLAPKSFLCCVSMLAGLRAGKGVLPVTRAELLDLPLGKYKEFRDAATRGYIAAAKFLVREAAFVSRELRSMDLVTALAAVLGHLGGDADAHEVQRRISRWFRCMANSGAYANGDQKTMAADVPAAVRWVASDCGDAGDPRGFEGAVPVGSALLCAGKLPQPGRPDAVGTSSTRTALPHRVT